MNETTITTATEQLEGAQDLTRMIILGTCGTTTYLRIPKRWQVPAGLCTCNYCVKHPDEQPAWDTLAVDSTSDYPWRLHMPEGSDAVLFRMATGKRRPRRLRDL